MRPNPDFDAYHATWTQAYDRLNYDRSLSAVLLRQSHRLAERPFGPETRFDRVVEVGAGTGEHIGFVRHGFGEYLLTDLSTSMLERARDRLPEETRGRVRVAREDATRLSLPDASVDRLIATHVLEHLERPHEVLREWNRVVRPGGVLSIVLPCDPGFLWRFGRTLGPRRNAQRAGIEYDYWMAREHINPIGNLVTFLRYYFSSIDEIWYPSILPSTDLNLFYACTVRKPAL